MLRRRNGARCGPGSLSVPPQTSWRHPHADRFLAVLDAAARKSDWSSPPAQGVYRGIALHEAYASYTAGVIEISLDNSGEVRVHRMVYAIDPGHAVNPLTIEEQTEGVIVWG